MPIDYSIITTIVDNSFYRMCYNTIVMKNCRIVFMGTPAFAANILEGLLQDGYDIVVRPDNNYFDSTWGEHTAAFFNPDKKLIVMRRMYDNYIPYHEMGHYVDWKLSFIYDCKASATSEFLAVYDTEADSFNLSNASYARSSSGEYFAQSFAMYILNPEELAEVCPDTFLFLKQCMQDVSSLSVAA